MKPSIGGCWFPGDDHEGEVWSYKVDRRRWDALRIQPTYHRPASRGSQTSGPGWWDDPMHWAALAIAT